MTLATELCSMGEMFPILSILALVAVFAAAQDGGQPGETELAHIASLHRSVYEGPSRRRRFTPRKPPPASSAFGTSRDEVSSGI